MKSVVRQNESATRPAPRFKMPDARVFILGAGFSHAAGLPMTSNLLPLMHRLVRRREAGHEFHFQRGIRMFFPDARFTPRGLARVDIEPLLSLHECKHHTEMYGGEGWSAEGSKELIIMKSLLAEALSGYDERLPSPYYRFASMLRPNDYILTFNWDTVLEEALRSTRKRYSLTPKGDSICVLKMHGSVDWKRLGRDNGFLTDAAYPQTKNKVVGTIYQYPCLESAAARRRHAAAVSFAYVQPYIILPSFSKLQWLDALKDYWYRTSMLFTFNVRQVVIIGYSLRRDDYHARSFLIPGLQTFLYRNRRKVLILDPCRTIKDNYEFLPPSRIEHQMLGFDDAGMSWLEQRLTERN